MSSPFVLEDPFEVDYERAANKAYPRAYRSMMSPEDDVILMDRGSDGKARFHAGALPRSGWSPGKTAAAGAAGAVLAGALTVGLMKLLSKKKNGSKEEQNSRRVIRRTTPMQLKKGGVAKKRKGKQIKKKMVRKTIRKVARKN